MWSFLQVQPDMTLILAEEWLLHEVMREQLVGVTCVDLSWHEFVLVKSAAELECRPDVTCFASTMPLLTSSLPGQAQDMPPRCLHLSTLLHSLLVDNSAGINLDEP